MVIADDDDDELDVDGFMVEVVKFVFEVEGVESFVISIPLPPISHFNTPVFVIHICMVGFLPFCPIAKYSPSDEKHKQVIVCRLLK